MECVMARKPVDITDLDQKNVGDGPNEDDADDGPDVEEQTDSDGNRRSDAAGATIASSADLVEIYLTNARDGLNLRSGPSTDFSIIKSLPYGTRVHLLRREGRWALIDEQGDGAADGFVHMAFLEVVADRFKTKEETGTEEDVRAFWAGRNPRGARLYTTAAKPLVDPHLLHAAALGIINFELVQANHRVELYGPNAGFRTTGSTINHGAQPGTGRGAALDFVLIDRTTGKMLTNHPGKAHQYQGSVGENAPLYQIYFNEVVRAGSQHYPRFADKARFGGYFKSGDNALDTMHVDMRGEVAPMAGGSLKEGYFRFQRRKWGIPANYPYT
jgi:hypothetical protein